MIFVTVGTHEQQFDRLVKKVDELKGRNLIREQVVIQTGFSTYEPSNCIWKQWLSHDEMYRYVKDARIVVTHGGPASFLMPVQMGKVPVVVPRQQECGEHVNNHQLTFAKSLSSRGAGLIVVEDIADLGDVLTNYDRYVEKKRDKNTYHSNNLGFNHRLEEMAESLFAS